MMTIKTRSGNEYPVLDIVENDENVCMVTDIEDGKYNMNLDIPFINSDKVILSCKCKIVDIEFRNALVKQLQLKPGHLITIDYELENNSTANGPGSHMATIYNSFNGLSVRKTLNALATFIKRDIKIYRVI